MTRNIVSIILPPECIGNKETIIDQNRIVWTQHHDEIVIDNPNDPDYPIDLVFITSNQMKFVTNYKFKYVLVDD